MPVPHPDDAVIDVGDDLETIRIERPGRLQWKIGYQGGHAVLDSIGPMISVAMLTFYDGYHYCVMRTEAGGHLVIITAEIDGFDDDYRSLARSLNWLANYRD